jgi:hypothetical protein
MREDINAVYKGKELKRRDAFLKTDDTFPAVSLSTHGV